MILISLVCATTRIFLALQQAGRSWLALPALLPLECDMGQTPAWAAPSPAAFITTLVVLALWIFPLYSREGPPNSGQSLIFPQGLSGDQGRDWLKGQEKPQGFWLALHGGLTSAERNLGSSWSSAFRRFFFCLSLANKGLYRAAGEPFTLEKLWLFRAGSQGGAWASSRGYISRSAYCKWTLQHCHVLSMTCCPVLVLPAPGKALTHLREV